MTEPCPIHIAFEGPIGAGKTTLSKLLAAHLGGEVVLENFEGNPFLADFYGERDRWGLAMQLWFLSERHAQLSKVNSKICPIVADHTLFKDRVFAHMLLPGRELSLYERLASAMHESVETPSLIVFLEARDDVLLTRIKQRGRPYEEGITINYLRSLRESYAEQFRNLPSKLMRVDTSDLDLTSEEELQELYRKVLAVNRSTESETTATCPAS